MLTVWEILRKSEAWAKIGHLYGKATGNSLGGFLSLVGEESKGIIKLGWTVSTRLMESQLRCTACSTGKGLSKRTWHMLAVLSERKLPLPILTLFTLTPDSLVLPCVSLTLFKLLLERWSSEQVSSSVSKYMCRPFKRNTWDCSSTLSHSAIFAGFYSQKLWRLFFLSLEPWAEGSGVGLRPLTPQGDFHSWDNPLNF